MFQILYGDKIETFSRSTRSRIAIVVAALPPTLDGIGDYSAMLAGELAQGRYDVDLIIFTDSRATPDPIHGARIRGVFDPNVPSSAWALIDEIIADRPDWVILQYNPFSFGNRGLNLHLPRALAQLKVRAPSVRLAVMFHETYTPIINLKFAIMTTWQRWQFYQIARAADVLFFSISSWAEQNRSWFPTKPIYHLAVGSNMPRPSIELADAKQRLGVDKDEIVLGLFGSGHLSRLLRPVVEAVRAVNAIGRLAKVLYIGPHAEIIRAGLGDLPAILDGPFSPQEVSRRLSAVDIFLASHVDGISTRRTTLMAAMQHRLAIVGTVGQNTDSELIAGDTSAFVLTPAAEPEAFGRAAAMLAVDGVLRRRLANGAFEMFERNYSWPAIAKRLMDHLDVARNNARRNLA